MSNNSNDYGPGGNWPSKTGKPSGGNRNPGPKTDFGPGGNWPSKTGNPSGGGRNPGPKSK